jgi:hypothetical protein
MKKWVFGMVLVVFGVASLARDARADEMPGPGYGYLETGFGFLDLALAATDLTGAVQPKPWRSRGYGVFEALAGGAELALCLDGWTSSTASNVGHDVWKYGAALGAVFMAHGVWMVFSPRTPTEAPAPPGAVTVAPIALSDVARTAVPGLGVLARF